ncbi:MAG: NUDIX domain-containing protein [Granulosicoccaceae bacterium]
MLDIVNEADEVVAHATRDAVHAGNHLHRATHMVLQNSSAEVFVQLRSLSKDMHPGLWDTSAAGHVDAGESYIDCAVRELQEELGVQVLADQLHEFMRVAPSEDNGYEFVRVYWVNSDAPITLEAKEIDDGRWMSASALDNWLAESPGDFTPDFHQIWQNAKSLLNSPADSL